MLADRDELTQAFRTAYGRLCVLTAKALKQNHPPHHVAQAVLGKGFNVEAVYVILRRQRALVKTNVEQCFQAGMTVDEITNVCQGLREVVESEWMLKLPLFAEVAS